MSIKNLMLTIGGIIIIVSVFLPVANVMGVSISFMSSQASIAYFFIAVGIICAVSGLFGGKVLSIISLISGILILILSAKYLFDSVQLVGSMGLGTSALAAGALLVIIGSLQALRKKKI